MKTLIPCTPLGVQELIKRTGLCKYEKRNTVIMQVITIKTKCVIQSDWRLLKLIMHVPLSYIVSVKTEISFDIWQEYLKNFLVGYLMLWCFTSMLTTYLSWWKVLSKAKFGVWYDIVQEPVFYSFLRTDSIIFHADSLNVRTKSGYFCVWGGQ